MKKYPYLTGHRRKNDILMTLKTRDILGFRKHFEDPLVIPKKDTTVGGIGSDKRLKSWTKICKCLFNKDYDDILKIFIYFVILLSYIMIIALYFDFSR